LLLNTVNYFKMVKAYSFLRAWTVCSLITQVA